MIRAWVGQSKVAMDRVFGCFLILLGARVAMLQ
jgi:hypothetical protein